MVVLVTIYFGINWYKNDTSGESIFAMLLGLVIPFLFYFRNKKDDTYKINIIEQKFTFESNKINIIFPKVKYEDNTLIENKINNLINNIYLRHGVDIKRKKVLEDSISEFNSSFEQSYKIKNIFGIKFINWMYYDGAAHGNDEIVSLNINLNNGEEFEFKDIFRGKYKDLIIDLVKDKLKEHDCKDSYFDFDNIQLRDTQEFYISDNKLIIIFFKYEIAPGCCGSIEISLDLNEVIKYINPNGPLYFLYADYDTSHVEKGHTILFAMDAYKKISNKTEERNE